MAYYARKQKNIHFVYEQAREALAQDVRVTTTIYVHLIPKDKLDGQVVVDHGPGGVAWLYDNSKTGQIEIEFEIDSLFWSDSSSDVKMDDKFKLKDIGNIIVDNRFMRFGSYNANIISEGAISSLSQVVVHSPRALIEKTFQVLDLPSIEWFRRYTQFRSDTMLELLSVSWRYICIQKRTPEHGLAAELVRIMRDYLDRQSYEPDRPVENTLRTIADRVIQQLREDDLNSSVLRAARPQMSAPAAKGRSPPVR